jgi:hypothetical protein
MPTNGETICVRLFTSYNGVLAYNDYTFTAAPPATMTAPTAGSTLAGPGVKFTWTAATGGVTGYYVRVETSAGTKNLVDSGEVTGTSWTYGSMPTNGESIYVRLFTSFNGVLAYNDNIYTAANAATMTTPTAGSTLPGPSVKFTWTPATGGVSGYYVWVGTSAGTKNLVDSGEVTGTSWTYGSMPTNGETIYVRLFTSYSSALEYADYVYTAAKAGAMTAPTAGSTLSGARTKFTWTTATGGATGYYVWVGTSAGTKNLVDSGEVTGPSWTYSSMPTNGEKIYARLFTSYNGVLAYADYVYTAYTAP